MLPFSAKYQKFEASELKLLSTQLFTIYNI